MKRRSFLLSSLATAALGSLPAALAQTPTSAAAAAPAGPPPSEPKFTPLRRNVGFFTARGGTIGWLSSKDALAAVDTQFPDTATQFLAGLPDRGDRLLDVVINTHHHGDHTGGNGVFKPATKKLVAHANVPDLQRGAAERAQPPTTSRQVYADVTFPEKWSMSLGDETLSAAYFGAAHTKGDIVVYFEKANVVHTGDLMFNRIFPVIDRVGGANIRHWTEVLPQIAETYPSDARYIFGHGNPKFGVTGSREDLFVLRDYLVALLEHVQKEIKAGKTKEEVVVLKEFPGFPDFNQPGPNSRLPSNLGVAYEELSTSSGRA